MSMVINTNIASMTAQRHLTETRADMETAMERLASGKRINSVMDDAAGLAITHKLDAKIAGLNQAVRNAQDGISLVQTAEGALEAMSMMLTRMKELATQAANGTYEDDDLGYLDAEFQALITEIDQVATNTDFNGISVLAPLDSGTSGPLDGSDNPATQTIKLQVGDGANDTIEVTLQN